LGKESDNRHYREKIGGKKVTHKVHKETRGTLAKGRGCARRWHEKIGWRKKSARKKNTTTADKTSTTLRKGARAGDFSTTLLGLSKIQKTATKAKVRSNREGKEDHVTHPG